MPKVEIEKINCLDMDCARGRRPKAKSNRYVELRSRPTVWIVFAAQTFVSRQKLALLVFNGFYLPIETPNQKKKTAKTAVFGHRWQAWKVVRSIAAVCQRPKTPQNWQCSFAFFVSFFWHFNEKQLAEVIFVSSRLVVCKNQENSAWSNDLSPLPFRHVALW